VFMSMDVTEMSVSMSVYVFDMSVSLYILGFRV